MYRSIPILYRMADAFFRNRWLFLTSFLVVSGITMGVLYSRSKTYAATALTQVITQDVAQALGEQEDNSWVSPAQKNVNQLDVLLNGDFLGTALRGANNGAGLARPINTDPAAEDPRYTKLRQELSTSVQSDNLFAISLTWDNPTEAEQIVRAIQSQFIQEIGEERYAQTNATLVFLNSQIGIYDARLRQAEKLLTDYKRTNPGQLPEAQTAEIGQLEDLKNQLGNMEITAKDADMKRAALEQRLAQITPQNIAEQTNAPSPLDLQINDMKARRDTLLTHLLPSHPKVLDLDNQIAALEKQRDAKSGGGEAQKITQTRLQDNPEWQSVHEELTNAKIEQSTQSLDMQRIRQKIAQLEVSVAQIPIQQRNLTDKTRDYSVVKTQYDALVTRREQVEMEGNLARVTASSSLSPIGYIHADPTTGRMKMALMFIGSVLLGLVVGVILVVLCEWSDRSVRYGSDAERLFGLPVLAVVPMTADLRLPSALDEGRTGRRRRRLSAPKDQDGAPELEALTEPERRDLDLPPVPVMAATASEGAQ